MRGFAAAVLSLAIYALPAIAQEQLQVDTRAYKGGLAIRVRDVNGDALPNATVTIKPANRPTRPPQRTDGRGITIFSDLSPNEGEVVVTARYGSLVPGRRTLKWMLRDARLDGEAEVRVIPPGGSEGPVRTSIQTADSQTVSYTACYCPAPYQNAVSYSEPLQSYEFADPCYTSFGSYSSYYPSYGASYESSVYCW